MSALHPGQGGFRSDEFHNKRAIFQARHYGIEAIGFNADDSPFRYWRIKIHLREYLARVKVMLEVAGKCWDDG